MPGQQSHDLRPHTPEVEVFEVKSPGNPAADLAAAQELARLHEAYGNAEAMIKQAVKESRPCSPASWPSPTRSRRASGSSFFSFVKAIVKVVGLCRPRLHWCGEHGDRVQIADQALSVCEKVIHLDFKNLASGVQGLAEVVPPPPRTWANRRPCSLGERRPKSGEKGFKSWVNSTRRGMFTGITGEVKKFADALKDVPLDGAPEAYRGCFFGSDFPVKGRGGTPSALEIGEKGLRLEGDLKANSQQLLGSRRLRDR